MHSLLEIITTGSLDTSPIKTIKEELVAVLNKKTQTTAWPSSFTEHKNSIFNYGIKIPICSDPVSILQKLAKQVLEQNKRIKEIVFQPASSSRYDMNHLTLLALIKLNSKDEIPLSFKIHVDIKTMIFE